MSEPRAFVSFDFDNNLTDKNLFAGQCHSESPTPFTVQDWSSKSPLPQKQWEALIRSKIGKTDMLVVLVGNSMASASGVAKEIAMAKEQNVPILGVYVNGAGTGSALPAGLPRNRVISWTWKNVAAAVDQAMTEGKNE